LLLAFYSHLLPSPHLSLVLVLHINFKCLLEGLEGLQEVLTSLAIMQEDLDLVLAENQRMGPGVTQWLEILFRLLVLPVVRTWGLLVKYLFLKFLVSKLLQWYSIVIVHQH
jgi:hypothetical protein